MLLLSPRPPWSRPSTRTRVATRQRIKHIEIQYHYVRELINDETVELEYCPTSENVADSGSSNKDGNGIEV